jgi:hypothetical protein
MIGFSMGSRLATARYGILGIRFEDGKRLSGKGRFGPRSRPSVTNKVCIFPRALVPSSFFGLEWWWCLDSSRVFDLPAAEMTVLDVTGVFCLSASRSAGAGCLLSFFRIVFFCRKACFPCVYTFCACRSRVSCCM